MSTPLSIVDAPLIDTHCHLTFGKLSDDIAGTWQRAKDSGIVGTVVVGIDAETSRDVVGLAANSAMHGGRVRGCVGIHPNETAGLESKDFDTIEELSGSEHVVAVGESGVDLYWKRASLREQQDSLAWHADLAVRRDLPLVLHIRDGFEQTVDVLGDFERKGLRGIVHCFSGGPEDLEPFLTWGFSISFSGMITYPKAQPIRDAARQVPLDRCLVETDAPWLPPVPHRGKTNEPAFVRHTASRLADVKGITERELALATTRNAQEIFRAWPDIDPGANPDANNGPVEDEH